MTENHRVGGSIPPLGTLKIKGSRQKSPPTPEK
jgi:hypothetical protein